MAATEDLFTAIHKALRSMIYDLGGRLQTNDFGDIPATAELLRDVELDFAAARSAGCVVCILHHHAEDEESAIFPAVAPHGSALIGSLIEEHHELTRREAALANRGHAIVAMPDPAERIREGQTLNRSANELFALYLAHMNREDELLVPLMREHFTNEQMAAMRGTIMGGMPPDRLMRILRWMLPSLNVSELTEFLTMLKKGAPPPLVAAVNDLGSQHVDPSRWQAARQRVGA